MTKKENTMVKTITNENGFVRAEGLSEKKSNTLKQK